MMTEPLRLRALPEAIPRGDEGSGVQPEVPSDLPPRGPHMSMSVAI